MPRKAKCPIVPFASVGETVIADNGQSYVIMWIEGAKVRLKHLGPSGKAGKGRPSNGLMIGDPDHSLVDNRGQVFMEGEIPVISAIDIPVFTVSTERYKS